MNERHELGRLLVDVADDFPRIGGLLRRAARELILSPGGDRGPDRCPSCGGVVPQSGRGRPRVYCLVCSPRREKSGKVDDGQVREKHPPGPSERPPS